MTWRKPDHFPLPKQNQIVWVLIQHWKENGPLSCEIVCGEVSYSYDSKSCAVFNNDDIGSGSLMWIFRPTSEHRRMYEDKVLAWLPVEELPLPNWVPNGTR